MFIVGSKENSISVEIMYVTYSLYTGEPSTLIVNGWGSTYDYRSECWLEESYETYNPLADKFQLSAIQVNDTVYLRRNTDGGFPGFPSADNTARILHGPPEEINGYDGNNFFLGVVTNLHNRIGVTYSWYRNNHIYLTAPNQCLLKITEPGNYFCKVTHEITELQSATVNVLRRTSTFKEPTKDTVYPPSVSSKCFLKDRKLV